MRRLADFVVRWPWAVIGIWVALLVALPLACPSLSDMAQKHPLAILPSDAPSSVTAQKMTEAFHESGNNNLLLVALINENGLGPSDEATYRKLVDCAARRRDRCRERAGFHRHPTAETVPDQQGQDHLGACRWAWSVSWAHRARWTRSTGFPTWSNSAPPAARWKCTSPAPRPPPPTSPSRERTIGSRSRSRSRSWSWRCCWWSTEVRSRCCCRW